MPIYAYRCTTCGHAQDVLQKMSDPLLTVCPNCGNPTYQKQVTAAGFQLKGSGWYVTDFRGDKSTATPPPKPGDDSGSKGKDGTASDAGTAAGTSDSKKSEGSAAAGTPAPSPSASPAPSAGPAASSSAPPPPKSNA